MGDTEAKDSRGDILDWTVLKCIQEANAASMGAMEEYLLCATDPDALGDVDQTIEFLERSIDHHEQVVEQLELAREELDQRTQLKLDD